MPRTSIKANGGALTSFDDVIKAAYNDMYEDTKTIREKRKMTKAQIMKQKH
jgi:copper chaperone NosL